MTMLDAAHCSASPGTAIALHGGPLPGLCGLARLRSGMPFGFAEKAVRQDADRECG
jgi:hypothetical protein